MSDERQIQKEKDLGAVSATAVDTAGQAVPTPELSHDADCAIHRCMMCENHADHELHYDRWTMVGHDFRPIGCDCSVRHE